MLGDDFLVGRHHMLAAQQGFFDIVHGRVLAAKDLDNDVYLRVGQYLPHILGEEARLHSYRALLQYLPQNHRAADRLSDNPVFLRQGLGHPAAHRPQTHQANADALLHTCLSRCLPSHDPRPKLAWPVHPSC